MQTLKQMLEERKLFKTIPLFFDIETYQYNEQAGKKKPSKYKNMTFSVAISWMNQGQVNYEIFPNFKELFDVIITVFKNVKNKPNITLNAHNTNKYDNHFLRYELMHYYNLPVENYYLNTATTEKSNENSLRLKDLTNKEKQGIILEKRIKSKINLELIFYLKGIKFETVDNWVKTNSSIAMLGKKLKRLNLVTDDELKTDFNYTKYNVDHDLTEQQARDYAKEIFDQLSEDELTYIRNDVILLAKSVYYYDQLFKNFDYSKRTFTSNILESYNTNDLTSYQLLNRIGQGEEKYEIRYTDYKFANQNFYDYLKPFYRGGLNFYNQYYIGKIIDTGVFSLDINSSYPYAMHNFKIPTYLNRYKAFEKETEIELDTKNDNEYTLYQMTKHAFDFYILQRIDSIILKQMFVKYYSTNEFININTYTIKMIENVTGLEFNKLPVMSYVVFDCEYFGSREQIEEFYFVKTQGSLNKKINFNNPYDIKVTNEENTNQYSREEIDNSKVNLNGLYGIPALRPYFNLFRKNEEDEYYNIENGHKNAERNIVFSIFVTSVSLWNLLDPLKYLTQEEIDENFLYCDTDSLYLKKEIQHKIKDEIFDPYHLGKWDLEHDHLTHFYILNHKKYCFMENNEIMVKAGGIPNEAFNRELDFETFIKTQFSDGVEIKNTKSIYNEQGTISIYPSKTILEVGKGYRIHANSTLYNQIKEQMIKDLKSKLDDFTSDILYIESVIGTFSLSDLFPVTHDVEKKQDLKYLKCYEDQIKNLIKD